MIADLPPSGAMEPQQRAFGSCLVSQGPANGTTVCFSYIKAHDLVSEASYTYVRILRP